MPTGGSLVVNYSMHLSWSFAILLTLVFTLGYALMVMEGFLKISKTATALVTGVLCWILLAFSGLDSQGVHEELARHLSAISQILFFLMGAMTIV
ncbi:MAG: hypothetical protein JNM63_16875, partial [Spirochaetia bacterium]|nr:hypothetical protein [Spirochaetia bacterium]